MSLQAIEQISSSLNISQELATADVVNAGSEITFKDVLINGIENVNQSLNINDQNIEKLALGETISTHDLMITMEQAKFQLELAIEVRNRLVEGYQEIMRMQL